MPQTVAQRDLGNSTEEPNVTAYKSFNKYALIVGINDYSSEKIPSLRYAVRDAEELYKVVTDPRRGGFSPESVVLLTDNSEVPPTRTNFGLSLNTIRTQAQKDDLVLIFFSGHGYEDDGRAYLLPRDADIDALDYSAIERDAFVRQIDGIVAKKVIVILDACHAGGISRGGKGVGRDARLSERYYEQFASSQGRAFIASCSGGQLSWEDEETGHSVFTQSLLHGLTGEADQKPQDGIVSLHELRRFLEQEVSDWARRLGKRQQPQVRLESAYGDIPIALNSDFLEDQAEQRRMRHREAGELKFGLVGLVELEENELAAAVGLLDRMVDGNEMTSDEEKKLQFIRNLVDGSIDIEMYRAGVRGLSPTVVPGAPKKTRVGRGWFATAAAGGFFHAGGDFSGGVKFGPSARLGYSRGRWALVANYTFGSGELAEFDEIQQFSAHLLTLGPRLNLPLSNRLRSFLQLGIGGYVGTDVRSEEQNFALDLGGGLDIKGTSGISASFLVSFVLSNAALIAPSQPELGQALYFGIGITYGTIK